MESIYKLSLKKNFSWNLAGNVIYSFSQWGVLVILANIGNPEIVGQFSLGLAITAPIILLLNLQLRALQATDTRESFRFGEYLGLRILTNLFSLIIFLIVLMISNYSINTSIVIFLVGISKIIESMSDIVQGYLQQKERMDYGAKSKIIKGVLVILFVAVTMKITQSVIYTVISLCIAYLLVFLFYDLRTLKAFTSIKVIFEISRFKSIIILALPLGITLMLGSLYTNIPRIFIEKYLGEDQLGYFAAIAYLIVAGNTFVAAVGQAAAPRLAKLYAMEDLKAFDRLWIKLMVMGFVFGLLILLIALFQGPFLLSLFYGSDYSDYSYLFNLLLFAGAFNFASSFIGHGITATRSFKIQPILGTIWFLSSLVSSLILIPKLGLIGAGYAVTFSSIIQFLSQLIVLWIIKNKKRIKVKNTILISKGHI